MCVFYIVKMRCDDIWDIRINDDLRSYWSTLRQKGAYYWKLSDDECIRLARIICDLYEVPCPKLEIGSDITQLKRYRACGLYVKSKSGSGTVFTYRRPHFKTLVHELYHHIDFVYRYDRRNPLYDSSDRMNYAWNFAELVWKRLH